MYNFIFIGPPGSGKGTQASQIATNYNLLKLSTGDELRSEIRNKTPIGNLAKSFIDQGKLVPDDLIIDLLMKKLEVTSNAQGIILDGFPRTVPQAIALDQALEKSAECVHQVFFFDSTDQVIVDRVTKRFACDNCGENYNYKFKMPQKDGICDICKSTKFTSRSDDSEEVVRKRIEAYRELTSPVIEYYRRKDLVFNVNSDLAVDIVYSVIEKQILEIFKKNEHMALTSEKK